MLRSHTGKSPKILIAFPSSRNSRTEKMSGIYRYLNETHQRWEFVIMHEYMKPTVAYIRRLVQEGLDGAIVTAVDMPPETVAYLSEVRLPLVTIALPLKARPRTAFVLSDNAAQGKLVAHEFLKLARFHSFAYVPLVEPPEWCTVVAESFRHVVSEFGFDATVYTAAPEKDRAYLMRWLRTLPKPAAILAANDYRANDVLVAAQKAKIDVPSELAVIGVDNDVTLCENTSPRLTSVQPDFERQGYEAARLLDNILHGASKPVRLAVGPRMIAWRESAVPSASTGGMLVQRALDFINRECSSGIGVRDVVAYLKVSRPLVDLRFRQLRGQSVLATIIEVRLEKTRELLISAPHLSIAEVCQQVGWKSERYPKRLFLQRYGQTMREARRLFN